FIMRAFRSIPLCAAFVVRSLGEAQAYLDGTGHYADRLNYPFPDGLLIALRAGDDFASLLTAVFADFPKLPVFILSGGATPGEVESAYRLGAKEVIEKPSNADALRELLQRLAHDLCENTLHSSPDMV